MNLRFIRGKNIPITQVLTELHTSAFLSDYRAFREKRLKIKICCHAVWQQIFSQVMPQCLVIGKGSL